jgi:hypothetical protein
LSAGALTAGGDVVIGYDPLGVGTMTQTGGSVVSGNLTVGNQGSGTYMMSGGTLNFGTNLVVGLAASSSATLTLIEVA